MSPRSKLFGWRELTRDRLSSFLVLEAKLVLHPRVNVWALKAGVQVPFTLDLARVELTALRVVAGNQIRVDVLLALPRLKVGNLRQRRRCAHPLNCLVVADQEDVLQLERES